MKPRCRGRLRSPGVRRSINAQVSGDLIPIFQSWDLDRLLRLEDAAGEQKGILNALGYCHYCTHEAQQKQHIVINGSLRSRINGSLLRVT